MTKCKHAHVNVFKEQAKTTNVFAAPTASDSSEGIVKIKSYVPQDRYTLYHKFNLANHYMDLVVPRDVRYSFFAMIEKELVDALKYVSCLRLIGFDGRHHCELDTTNYTWVLSQYPTSLTIWLKTVMLVTLDILRRKAYHTHTPTGLVSSDYQELLEEYSLYEWLEQHTYNIMYQFNTNLEDYLTGLDAMEFAKYICTLVQDISEE